MKKNNRKSESFIVTDTGEWVDSTILEEYKISAKADMDADGSKQVHEEDCGRHPFRHGLPCLPLR